MEEEKKEEFFIISRMDKLNKMCENFFKNNNEKSVNEIKELLNNNGFFDKDLDEIIVNYFDYDNNEENNESSPNPEINNIENNNKKNLDKNNFYHFLLFIEALTFNNKKNNFH